jgi:hypothetical protein
MCAGIPGSARNTWPDKTAKIVARNGVGGPIRTADHGPPAATSHECMARQHRLRISGRSTATVSNESFWMVGQFGILLEFAGALHIALSSIAIHKRIERLFHDFLGFTEIPRIIQTMSAQTKTDIKGFTLLAGGLMLQFIGNFGSAPL